MRPDGGGRGSGLFRRVLLTGCAVLWAVLFVIALALSHRGRTALPASAVGTAGITFVLDAGHGGEDGGAVSPEGVAESGIDLEVASRIRDLLRLCGARTVMTREEDVSLGDPSLGTVRARKASDLRRRTEIVDAEEGAVLVSVHQNSLPSSPVTHGAQVFWNARPGGQELAEAIQDALNESVGIGNEKAAREIAPTIYLTAHVHAPAALVECGFLSNAAEAEKLQEAGYQKELAAAIAAGCLRYAGEGGP